MKMKIRFLFVILFSAFLLSANETLVESVVASLNERAITYSEIVQEGELLNIENNADPQTPLSKELKERVLELILFRIIIFEEAISQGVTIEEEMVKKKVKTYSSNVYMKAFRKKYEISDIEFETILKIRLIADRMTELFLEKKFKGKMPTDKEKSSAVEEWRKNLLKKQKLVIYSMP
jgi:hypothetical protein